MCCYGCVRKNILRKHIVNKHGEDALPEDMLSKRANYPPKKSFNRVDLNMPRQPQMPTRTAESDSSLNARSDQNLEVNFDSNPGQASGLAVEKTGFQPNVTLDQAQVKDLTTGQKEMVRDPSTTNMQVGVSLDGAKVQYPSISNQISGQIYDMPNSQPGLASLSESRLGNQALIGNRESQSELARHPLTMQSAELASPPLTQSDNSSLASVLPQTQQSLSSQHNFEFTAPPGYMDNPQMTLLQQMYLQTYGAGNSSKM